MSLDKYQKVLNGVVDHFKETNFDNLLVFQHCFIESIPCFPTLVLEAHCPACF